MTTHEKAVEPLQKTVTVACTAERAFTVFTAEIARWWPLATHSVGLERARSVVIEGHLDGEVYEVRDDGERTPWGRVTAWQPPRRLAFTWHPGREGETAQQVEVTFTPAGSGTTVQLVHTGWERLGARAQAVRERYQGGWAQVLGECFAQACGAAR